MSDWFVVPLLLTLLAVIHHKLILFNITAHDLAVFNHDYEAETNGMYIYQTLVAERMYLWLKHWGMGQPAVGLYVTSILYPTQLALGHLPPHLFFKYQYLIHVAVMGAGYYALFRVLRLSPFTALVISLWSVTAAFNFWSAPIWITLRNIALYPLLYAGIIKLLQKPTLPFFLLCAAVVALMIVAGDPETLAYEYPPALVFLVGAGLATGRGVAGTGKALFLFVLASAAGTIATASQILTFLELASQNVRMEGFSRVYYNETFENISMLGPLVGMLLSRLTVVHIGFMALLFGFAGLADKQRRGFTAVSAAIFLAVLAVLFGKDTPLADLLHQAPGFGKFVRHYKMGIVLNLHFLILAGCGLEYFFRNVGSRRLITIAAVFLALDALVNPFSWLVKAAALATGGFLVHAFLSSGRMRRAIPLLILVQSLLMILPKAWEENGLVHEHRFSDGFQEFADRHGDDIHRTVSMYPIHYRMRDDIPPANVPLQPGGVGGTLGIDIWFSSPIEKNAHYLDIMGKPAPDWPESPKHDFVMKSGFKSVDFVTPQSRHLVDLAGIKYFISDDFALREADKYLMLKDPAIVSLLRKQGMEFKDGRLVAPAGSRAEIDFEFRPGETLRMNVAEAGALASWSVEWGDSVHRENLVPGKLDYRPRLDSAVPARLVLEAASGGLVIDYVALHDPDRAIRLSMSGGGIDVYVNEKVFPRAFVVENVVGVRDVEEAKRLMSDPAGFSPAAEAVVYESDFKELAAAGLGAGGSEGGARKEPVPAAIVTYLAELVEMESVADRPSLLVLTDSWFPGWRAWVDGEEIQIRVVDIMFRGIMLKEGAHRVVMRYQPASFGVGLWSGLAMLVGGGYFGVRRLVRGRFGLNK